MANKPYKLTDEEIIRDCDSPACVLYKTPQEGHLIGARMIASAAQKKMLEYLMDKRGDFYDIADEDRQFLLKEFGIGENEE